MKMSEVKEFISQKEVKVKEVIHTRGGLRYNVIIGKKKKDRTVKTLRVNPNEITE